jgi:hypothetical protein
VRLPFEEVTLSVGGCKSGVTEFEPLDRPVAETSPEVISFVISVPAAVAGSTLFGRLSEAAAWSRAWRLYPP